MTDYAAPKPGPDLHVLNRLPASSQGLKDDAMEARCRVVLRLIERVPGAIRTAEDVALLAEYVEKGYYTEEVE